MTTMAFEIISVSIVCSAICSGADKKISKLHVTDLCDGILPVIGEFPAQRASNAEKVFICWRFHVATAIVGSTPVVSHAIDQLYEPLMLRFLLV